MSRCADLIGAQMVTTGGGAKYQYHFRENGRRANAKMRTFLREHGIGGLTSYTKFVPESVMTGGRDAWIGFLSGMFDTDGTVRPITAAQPVVRFDSVSRELLLGCQHLLEMLGVQSSLTIHRGGFYNGQPHTMFNLSVCGRSEVARLASILNSAHTKRSARLSAWAEAMPTDGYHVDFFGLDRVKSIEYLPAGRTILIEVDGTHSHVTNGLITHNSRKYQRGELLGFYRIPPHMAGDTEKSTSWGTGIEQMSVGFVTYTMMPYFARYEQAINMKLFGPASKFFAAFDPDGLLRGDFKTRMDGYAVGRQWGWLSVNDIRRKEDMAPLPEWGDVYLQPLNMQSAKDAFEVGPVAPRGMPGTEQSPDGTLVAPVAVTPPDPNAARAAILAHRFALADVTDRILKREQADVSRGIEKLLKRGANDDIPLWVEAFYADHRAWAAKMATPVFAGLAETVRALRGIRADECYVIAVQSAVDGYVQRLGSESQDDLRRAIRGEPDDLGRILSAWEHRSEKIAEREVIAAAEVLAASLGDPEEVAAQTGTLALAGINDIRDRLERVEKRETTVTVAPPQIIVNVPERETHIDARTNVEPVNVTVPERSVEIHSPVTVEGTTVNVPEREMHVDARTTVLEGAIHVDAPTDGEVETQMTYDGQGRIAKMSKRRKAK